MKKIKKSKRRKAREWIITEYALETLHKERASFTDYKFVKVREILPRAKK